MEKEFVTYKIVKELKELGFKDECLGFYDKDKVLHLISYGRVSYNNTHDSIAIHPHYRLVCSAPLYQQVIDWLRDIHNIGIYIDFTPKKTILFKETNMGYSIDKIDSDTEKHNEIKFKMAREQAILKAIELIKQK